MNKKIVSGLALGVALVMTAVSAQATPITYTLSGFEFVDGTAATGWFEFDADTKRSTAFDIKTTAGLLTAFEWTTANSGLYFGGGSGPNNFVLMIFSGARAFNFSFVDPFTNAGGTNVLNFGSECYNCSPYRRLTGGSVTSNVVPEPVTLALMLPALGALALRARRRKQAQA